MIRRGLLLTFVLMLLGGVEGLAWGYRGHELATEAATWGLPPDLPSFFHRAYPDLIHLANDPDRWRGAGPSLDDANGPDHFLDYEYVAHLELPPGRYTFIALLYESGTAHRLGLKPDTAGFVVWRIAELGERLTDQFRDWRRTEPGIARERIAQSIITTAGTMAHYVEDAANPHHATIHFNGWVGDPGLGFRNDCETHSRFESAFVSREIDLESIVDRMSAEVRRDDMFGAAVELLRGSNERVIELYTLDAAGAFDGPARVDGGRQFAAERLAVGASTIRDLWWTAWLKSGEGR
ncbi:MAG: hypothetical protein ABR517_10300 [Thermoanaerobaculia bacterium]